MTNKLNASIHHMSLCAWLINKKIVKISSGSNEKMSEIYTIFNHSYDNDNFEYSSYELFKQYQYKSECKFSYLFLFLYQRKQNDVNALFGDRLIMVSMCLYTFRWSTIQWAGVPGWDGHRAWHLPGTYLSRQQWILFC